MSKDEFKKKANAIDNKADRLKEKDIKEKYFELMNKHNNNPIYRGRYPNIVPELNQLLKIYRCCWSCGSSICR